MRLITRLSNSGFGTIERNATNANSLAPFSLTALSYVPALPYFYIEVTCDRASFTNDFYLSVQPEYPRSNGVSFAWIDTSGGTNLTLANDGYAVVSLPSSFYCKLYDYWFSYVYLFADGYLSVTSSGSPVNTGIPNTAYPYGIIAPFWDDLDPSAGGTVRYKFFGTSPNRYLVAEWNNVPRRSDPGTRVTFQTMGCFLPSSRVSCLSGAVRRGLRMWLKGWQAGRRPPHLRISKPGCD